MLFYTYFTILRVLHINNHNSFVYKSLRWLSHAKTFKTLHFVAIQSKYLSTVREFCWNYTAMYSMHVILIILNFVLSCVGSETTLTRKYNKDKNLS